MQDTRTAPTRRVLMLQGPHGPFFRQLADHLREAGCAVFRIGFNRGDEYFWGGRPGYMGYHGSLDDWQIFLGGLLEDFGITDMVLYGDTRPLHAIAVAVAEARGITIHVFEEGYVRPYWVTYERGGSNGHSRLMQMEIAEIRAAVARSMVDPTPAPARWGEMRQHILYGALYHFNVMTGQRRYPTYRPHRDKTVREEFRLYRRRLLLMPYQALERWLATRRVRHGGFPYHLVLLQLEHDASFRKHSSFASMSDFVDLCLDGFAKGAPKHHHIVFKAHPLEDGRAQIAQAIRRKARQLGLDRRVHFIRGGKLARLIEQARSAVTVNSTSAHQALWRGIPVRTLGRAIYGKPGLVSDQALPEFFASPDRPDMAAYRDFRQYLLETSQVPGGFYAAKGRHRLLRQVVDLMLAKEDPYDALALGKAAPRQQLMLVR